MLAYALRRSAVAALTLLTVLLILFAAIRLMPGDAATVALGPRASPAVVEEFRTRMGLDQPLPVQFLTYVGSALRGDLGSDVFSGRPVADAVLEVLPSTAVLAMASLGWAVLIGLPLGCYSAAHRGGVVDQVTGVVAVGAIAVPSFVVAIWLLLLFAITLRWFPVIGGGDPGDPLDQLHHLVLPALAVGLGWVGYVARVVRASMLDVLAENHVRAARAAGLSERRVVYVYALKLASLPVLTIIGMGFGGLLSGAVLAEIIFSRPGLGKLVYDSITARNFPVVQGGVLVATAAYVAVTLVTDLVVAAVDPRIRDSL